MVQLRAALRLVGLVAATTLVSFFLVLAQLVGLFSKRGRGVLLDGCTLGWGRTCAWLMGIRIEVEGTPPSPPFFLVSNHLSYLDIIVLYTRVRGRFLAKAEISSWPMFGRVARMAGTMYIDRGRRMDLSRVLPEVQSTLDGGRGVLVFPEGTSTRGDVVHTFKPSIFEVPIRTGVPVSYAALSYSTPEGAPPAHLAVCWWGDMPFFGHFFSLLTLTNIHATVAFGSHALSAEDRKALALRAQRAVESQFTPVVGCEA